MVILQYLSSTERREVEQCYINALTRQYADEPRSGTATTALPLDTGRPWTLSVGQVAHRVGPGRREDARLAPRVRHCTQPQKHRLDVTRNRRVPFLAREIVRMHDDILADIDVYADMLLATGSLRYRKYRR